LEVPNHHRPSDTRRIDHDRPSKRDPDMVDALLGTEEHQVTWLQRLPSREQWLGVILGLRGPWKLDACGGVRGTGQPRAVETGM